MWLINQYAHPRITSVVSLSADMGFMFGRQELLALHAVMGNECESNGTMVTLSFSGADPSSNLSWTTQGLSDDVLFLTDILNIFHSPIFFSKNKTGNLVLHQVRRPDFIRYIELEDRGSFPAEARFSPQCSDRP
jgi:hypothetical protein